MKKLKITPIKQIGTNNCWAACLSMALHYFGLKKTEKELDLLFEANNLGLDLYTLNMDWDGKLDYIGRKLLHPFNEDVEQHTMSFENIKQCIEIGQPIIIGVYEYKGLKAHALLVTGYDQDFIIFCDPLSGTEITMKFSDLQKVVSDYLIVLG